MRLNLLAVLLASAAAVPTFATVAHAQDAQSDAVYAIEAQDLAGALALFAAQAGVVVDADPALLEERQSAPVRGRHDREAALRQLLAGTGLTAVAQGGTVTIQRPGALAGDGRDIVVTGAFEASAGELQVRSNNAVSVLTPEAIRRTPDVNVADSLSRLPGVVVNNGGGGNINGLPQDIAGRGFGTTVSVRGMDAEYNINMINGIEAAQGKPFSRQVPLNLLPPVGLQQIVVNKSMQPSVSMDAIGGIIDFRTPNAFDFDDDTHFSIQASGQLSSRAKDYDQDAEGYGAAVDLGTRFGGGDFGIYVAGYYDNTRFTNSIVDGIYPTQTNGQYFYEVSGATAQASASGQPLLQNLVQYGVNAGFTTGKNERYGGNISLDYRPSDDLELYVRGTYATSTIEQASYYSQIYGEGLTRVANGDGTFRTSIGSLRPRNYYSTSPEEAMLATAQAGGKFVMGALTLQPRVFYSYGEFNMPDHIEISGRRPNGGPALPYGQSRMFEYRGDYPRLIGDATAYAYFDDIANYNARRPGDVSREFSDQERYGAQIDASIAFADSNLVSLDFGAKYSDSSRLHTYQSYTRSTNLFDANGKEFSWAQLGLFDGSVDALVPGVYEWDQPLINSGRLWDLFNSSVDLNNLANITSCGGSRYNRENCRTQKGGEAVAAAYVAGVFRFGRADLIAGLRYEHTKIDNVFWTTPAPDAQGVVADGAFSKSRTEYNEFLPSLQVNVRPSANAVFRLSASKTYARPAFFQLGGFETITCLDGRNCAENGGQTFITRGNPDLKPVGSINLDVSAEYSGAQTFLSVSAFYKRLSDFIYSTTNSFVNSGSMTDFESARTTVSQPLNGGSGETYGLEVAAEANLGRAVEALRPFTLGGNITLAGSSVNTGTKGLKRNERLIGQSDLTANAHLSFTQGPATVDVSYRYVGPFVYAYSLLANGGTPNSDLDGWVQARGLVDLHAALQFDRFRVDGAISNLFDTKSYHATVGRHNVGIGTVVDSGRIFSVKLSYTY